MNKTTYNIRIDKQVREQAEALYKSMGLSLSVAINLFLKQSIIQERLPLTEIIAEPAYANEILSDAVENDADINAKTVEIFDTPEELFKSWENLNE